jgi:hypothetical protein
VSIPKFYSPAELAAQLSVSIETLAQWRWLNQGPPFIRIGHGQRKLVRYAAPAVAAWLSADSKPTQGGLKR